MTWTTKTLERVNEYIVIKHDLRDMNGSLAGIKFRGGYAVVAKGSKAYTQIKKLPSLTRWQEYPLLFLRKLPFITRTDDVKMVYGQDVYAQYLKLLQVEINKEEEEREVQAEVKHIEEHKRCAYRLPNGAMCTLEAFEQSPGKHCRRHLLEDEKLAELGIIVPKRLAKDEVKKHKEIVINKLAKLR